MHSGRSFARQWRLKTCPSKEKQCNDLLYNMIITVISFASSAESRTEHYE